MILGYKDAKKLADKISKELEYPRDFVVRKRAKVIQIKHMDGSRFELHSACFRNIDNDWLGVFTEHHGDFIYHKDDVCYIREHLRPKSHYFNDEEV